MDIRDELQAINRVLACGETRSIPRVLEKIRVNTARRRKVKASKA